MTNYIICHDINYVQMFNTIFIVLTQYKPRLKISINIFNRVTNKKRQYDNGRLWSNKIVGARRPGRPLDVTNEPDYLRLHCKLVQ